MKSQTITDPYTHREIWMQGTKFYMADFGGHTQRITLGLFKHLQRAWKREWMILNRKYNRL